MPKFIQSEQVWFLLKQTFDLNDLAPVVVEIKLALGLPAQFLIDGNVVEFDDRGQIPPVIPFTPIEDVLNHLIKIHGEDAFWRTINSIQIP